MGKLRFWHQSMIEHEDLGTYGRFLVSHALTTLGDSATIDVHGVRKGTYRGRPATVGESNAFVYATTLRQVMANAIQAEADGYDAFVVGSFSEPYLREIRSAVRIPVVSIPESSMLVGCSFGRLLLPITNAPQIALLVNLVIERHRLEARVMRAVALDPALDEPALEKAFASPAAALQSFTRAAEEGIRAGAEVIIPAEGVLSTLLTSHKITQIAGAPVIDVFAVTWNYAVMLVHLRRQCNLGVSGLGYYSPGDPELVAQLKSEALASP